MAQISTNEFKPGVKLEIDGQPFLVVVNEFVKPGKGQAINRVKLKNLLTGRALEKTFKSGDKAEIADVVEAKMRLLYTESEAAIFMDDLTFEQITLPHASLGDTWQWLKDDTVYSVLVYKGVPVSVEAPTFMELEITETDPGARGDTSGRVLKAALLETGAKVQVPIFVDRGDKIKVDTRTGEYVSRAT